jgi:hypothetical protein
MPDYTLGRSVIVCKDAFAYLSHPSLTVLEGGEWLAAFNHSCRREHIMHPPSDPLFRTLLARSPDQGETWGAPEETPLDGHPGQLLVLRDGRLLCTYGRRKEPFGIRACLSEDGGRSWRIDREIVLRNDLPGWDIGYPTAIEYASGRLFVCYYGAEPDGVTCIQGTYLDLTP